MPLGTFVCMGTFGAFETAETADCLDGLYPDERLLCISSEVKKGARVKRAYKSEFVDRANKIQSRKIALGKGESTAFIKMVAT